MYTSKRNKKRLVVRLFTYAIVACCALVAYWVEKNPNVFAAIRKEVAKTPTAAEEPVTAIAKTPTAALEIPVLTAPRSEQLIAHTGYTVSYNLAWRIPNWVAYELTAEEVAGEEGRSDKFLPDPLVQGDPVVTRDYSNSGYDRGHMCPAADMKWSAMAMKESFYMTNICPQHHSNNAGDWKDLEELARDLATKYGRLYICCGPIVTDTTLTIGTERKIVVPQAFYKLFLRQRSNGEWTAIGFVMPNAAGNKPLMTYMHSVDEVEALTDIDFFPALPDSIETIVEADFTIAHWTL